MSWSEVRLRELEGKDVVVARELIKVGLREHLITAMNTQMTSNMRIWEMCLGFSALLSVFSTSFLPSLMIITSVNACVFYIAGLIYMNLSVIPDEVSDVDNDYSKRYLKYWVAEILLQGEWNIVGSVALRKCDDSKDRVELKRMAVRKECRRRGIANMLMNHVINFSSENGIKEIFLQLAPVQKQALTLYTKCCGFEMSKILRWKSAYGILDYVVYELVLPLKK